MRIETAAAGSGDAVGPGADAASGSGKGEDRPLGATGASDSLPADEGGAVLVGYGTVAPAKSRRRGAARSSSNNTKNSTEAVPATSVVAKPPIRKLAKDLGVELREVVGMSSEIQYKEELLRRLMDEKGLDGIVLSKKSRFHGSRAAKSIIFT